VIEAAPVRVGRRLLLILISRDVGPDRPVASNAANDPAKNLVAGLTECHMGR
jgi:hypothetical protein